MDNSELKIGIIGFGSIGMKHTEELIGLGVKNFFALRTNKGAKEMPENLADHVTNVFDEEEFLKIDLDGYIVANPTSLHIKAINLIAAKNKPIFVEKPLCQSEAEMENLSDLDSNLIQMGFCLRFHNVTSAIKEILNTDELGKVYHSRLNVGQYLPAWHPYTDYRTEYFSRKELGGGAIRTLSHELDLALHFFGMPETSKSITEKVSELQIDVDDYALVVLKFKGHLSRIEMDFVSKKTERQGSIFGTEADLHYDFMRNEIEIVDKDGNQVRLIKIEKSDIYKNQMEAFLKLINTKELDAKISTFGENINLLKIIENEGSI
jgi:predicted dehydrogenase